MTQLNLVCPKCNVKFSMDVKAYNARKVEDTRGYCRKCMSEETIARRKRLTARYISRFAK